MKSLCVSPGFHDRTAANAKAAKPKIESEQSIRSELWFFTNERGYSLRTDLLWFVGNGNSNANRTHVKFAQAIETIEPLFFRGPFVTMLPLLSSQNPTLES